MEKNNCDIKTWVKFAKYVRSKGCNLLAEIDSYPDAILVTGCQRSGTTILSRVITQSDGMVNYWFGKDDELDAALILSGYVTNSLIGRHCFQTTYLNECYREYKEIGKKNKIIWVLRNPYSVVYSMAYNWKRWALNELFQSCGKHTMGSEGIGKYKKFGVTWIPKLIQGCYSYNAKVSQLPKIIESSNHADVIAIEYDDMIRNPSITLKYVFDSVGLKYHDSYGKKLHKNSANKRKLLSASQYEKVNEICGPVYEKTKQYLTFNLDSSS